MGQVFSRQVGLLSLMLSVPALWMAASAIEFGYRSCGGGSGGDAWLMLLMVLISLLGGVPLGRWLSASVDCGPWGGSLLLAHLLSQWVCLLLLNGVLLLPLGLVYFPMTVYSFILSGERGFIAGSFTVGYLLGISIFRGVRKVRDR